MHAERVQALAHGGLSKLPAQFVRPTHERPENSKAVKGVSVPVISFSQPNDVLVNEISRVCSEWGFFMLIDHGISPELVRQLQEVGQRFFRLPQDEKEKYANDAASGNLEGYGTKMIRNHEQKLEWLDYFFQRIWPTCRVNQAIWPQNLPSYREVTEEYTKEVLKVTERILQLLSEGLGLEGEALKYILGGDKIELAIKINLYPPCPQPELALGVEPHTDLSALTILVPNNVPGFEVSKDGTWVAVDHIPNALIIHIGDQIEVLSNGKYKSVLHRSLVNKEQTRMSWAVFCGPPHDALIGPLPQLVNDQNPSRYATKTYEEYQYRKFNNLPQ